MENIERDIALEIFNRQKKIKVITYRENYYTVQYRYWVDDYFLGMAEVFLNRVTYFPNLAQLKK